MTLSNQYNSDAHDRHMSNGMYTMSQVHITNMHQVYIVGCIQEAISHPDQYGLHACLIIAPKHSWCPVIMYLYTAGVELSHTPGAHCLCVPAASGGPLGCYKSFCYTSANDMCPSGARQLCTFTSCAMYQVHTACVPSVFGGPFCVLHMTLICVHLVHVTPAVVHINHVHQLHMTAVHQL